MGLDIDTNTDTNTESENPFQFGPLKHSTAKAASFWRQHYPAMNRWLRELQRAGDLWWRSAQHAASCLVSYRESESEMNGESPHWKEFDIDDFLFHVLHEGGTVTFFGSVPIFFDQLVEGLRRFVDAGIVDRENGTAWIEQMCARRARFLQYYSDDDEQPE